MHNINRAVDGVTQIGDINLDVKPGGLNVLLCPTLSGNTSLMRTMAYSLKMLFCPVRMKERLMHFTSNLGRNSHLKGNSNFASSSVLLLHAGVFAV